MSRLQGFSNPLLLGFDEVERILERVTKSRSDGYPPYNIERINTPETNGLCLRISVAVAGFSTDDLDVSVENNQLVIRARQMNEPEREYLHRGIATRQFQLAFVLAEGIEVGEAELQNGLLSVEIKQPEPSQVVRKISITNKDE